MPALFKDRASCKSTIVGVFCVLIGLTGLVFGSYAYIAHAQWLEPHADPATWLNDPNIDAPLYSGDGQNYGGSAQARQGTLTIGSAGFTGTRQLNIEGEETITNSLEVGPVTGMPPSAVITAFANDRHGVYGKTTDAAAAGILGSNVAAGGSSISGDARATDGAVGVYGVATGNNSSAFYATNVGTGTGTGYAGYFDGDLQIANGNFTLTDAQFTGNVHMFQDLCSPANPCDVNGFHIDRVNARSVQDQIFGDPLNNPGIRMFELNTTDDICTLSDWVTPCPADGLIPVGESAIWDVSGTGLLDDQTVVVAYIAEYSDDEGLTFHPVAAADMDYQECDAVGDVYEGIFRADNSSATDPLEFRLIGYFIRFASDQVCDISYPSRQISVPDSDQYDTVQLSITGADAASIFSQSLPSGDDVYVTYMGADIDRDIVEFTNTNIEIWFRVQADTLGDNTNYFLTYADPARQSAPSKKDWVYYLWDDFFGNNEDPPNTALWSPTSSKNANCAEGGGSVTEIWNNQLWLKHVGDAGGCYSGSSASTVTEFPTSGKYSIIFDVYFNNGLVIAGNDGIYIRNPSVVRNTQYYDGPNEKALYIALGYSCSSNGIYSLSKGDRIPDSTAFFCYNNWGTTHLPQYVYNYVEGTLYNFMIELDADTRDYAVYDKVGSPTFVQRKTNNVPAADWESIGPTFVVDLNDGFYGDQTHSGAEKYDNFYIRRGKNDFDPQATVGPEL